jgi:hypothetical protein
MLQEMLVDSVKLQQLVVCPTLDDPFLIHDKDSVRVLYHCQTRIKIRPVW